MYIGPLDARSLHKDLNCFLIKCFSKTSYRLDVLAFTDYTVSVRCVKVNCEIVIQVYLPQLFRFLGT